MRQHLQSIIDYFDKSNVKRRTGSQQNIIINYW